MVKKDKVFELKIEDDDEISGIDSISLVDEPAIEVNWVAFKKETEHEFHIPDGEDDSYLEKLIPFGQNESELLEEFEVYDIEYPTKKDFISSYPNKESELDTNLFRIRYKYVKNPKASGSPVIATTRQFCKELINRQLVFRIEDMLGQVNDQGSSFADWRGGYNCRHIFAKIIYKKKGDIKNKAGNKQAAGYDILGDEQNDTRTENASFNNQYDSDFGKAEPIQINGVRIFEHGEDMDNYHDLETGHQASYLTDKGQKYAKDMGHWVYENSKDKLIHSGIKRAEQTAQIAAKEANDKHGSDKVKVESNPLLKTLDIGKYAGRKRGSFVEEYWLKHKDKKIPDGEKFQDFIDRMEKCYKFVESAPMNHQMVSHSKVIRALKALHDTGGGWNDETAQAFLNSRKDEGFDYNVGTIGGYVDPGIGKKKKKLDEKKTITPAAELAGPGLADFDYLKPNKMMSQEDFEETHSDYPDAVKHNAQAVLDYVEKNGWGSCGTSVGKQRANQLAKGEAISLDTIKRMYSYLSRHESDLSSSKGYGDGCGKLMYDAWGGKSAIKWAEGKIHAAEKKKMSKQGFATDDEKHMVLGPAMIPDMKIFRKDAQGNPYYVYFTADTIKQIAQKYMKNKYIDNNDMMHDGKAVPDVYVVESWIKESENDKSNDYGYKDLPVGTWFVSMKINNPEIWTKVKDHQLNGFSVSGYFEEVASFAKEEQFLKELAELLKSL